MPPLAPVWEIEVQLAHERAFGGDTHTHLGRFPDEESAEAFGWRYLHDEVYWEETKGPSATEEEFKAWRAQEERKYGRGAMRVSATEVKNGRRPFPKGFWLVEKDLDNSDAEEMDHDSDAEEMGYTAK